MTKILPILAPALGGLGLMLGTAYAVPTAIYNQQIGEMDQMRAEAALARAAAQEAAVENTAVNLDAMVDAIASGPVGGGVPAPTGLSLGLGRTATDAEVAAWDIDVRPDGLGLPEGAGDVWMGEEIYIAKCAMCHGDFGEAVGRWPVLAGGHGTLADEDPVKTIGSYWPYLSTVYDYVNRAMPFGEAQSLSADEVYAITAYLLYLNDMVDDDFELSHENFADIRLNNEDNFFMDDRAETELVAFSAEPCMSDCKDSVEITMRATVLDVTPEDDLVEEEDEAANQSAPTVTEGDIIEAAAAVDDDYDFLEIAGDAAYGEYLSGECTSCHQSTAADSDIPNITGWPVESFMLSMHDFKMGNREHEIMQMMAGRLSYEEIAALAAYFGGIE
ncbi:MAG: c-type cytochrome [Pseudomonadota bacterium]